MKGTKPFMVGHVIYISGNEALIVGYLSRKDDKTFEFLETPQWRCCRNARYPYRQKFLYYRQSQTRYEPTLMPRQREEVVRDKKRGKLVGQFWNLRKPGQKSFHAGIFATTILI